MRILVTAGPTREYFDAVRYISNASSGKMGYAIAAEAASRGHKVELVSGPVDLPPPTGVQVHNVVSAREMHQIAARLFLDCKVAIMAAAVCDYRPRIRLEHKLPKRTDAWSVDLEPTVDICAELGCKKGTRVVIGFALEDSHNRQHAEIKLQRKNCDAIVLNTTDAVGSDQATIQVLRPDNGWSVSETGSKSRLAIVLIDLAEHLAETG